MKRIVFIFIILPTLLFSQFKETSIFIEGGSYRQRNFNNSILFEFEGGLGLFSDFWLSPEIGLTYNTGSFAGDILTFPGQFDPGLDILSEARFNSIGYSLSPKIMLMRNEPMWWVIQPKVHFVNTTIHGDIITYDQNFDDYFLTDTYKKRTEQVFFTLSLGLETYLPYTEKFSFAFALEYTSIALGDNFDKFILDPSIDDNSIFSGIQNVGVSFKITYYPFHKETD